MPFQCLLHRLSTAHADVSLLVLQFFAVAKWQRQSAAKDATTLLRCGRPKFAWLVTNDKEKTVSDKERVRRYHHLSVALRGLKVLESAQDATAKEILATFAKWMGVLESRGGEFSGGRRGVYILCSI